jgi:hypothetical protein
MGLLATITLEVVNFRAYALLLVVLPYFNYTLEVVFSESVRHRLRFCLDHLNYVKMASFQFYIHLGKQKISVDGDDCDSVVGQKFSGGKGDGETLCLS